MRFLELSAAANCERCLEAMRPGDVIALVASEVGKSELYLHPTCASALSVDSFVRALETTTVAIPDRDALEASARRRQLARKSRADARWTVESDRDGAIVGVAPKRAFEDDVAIEPVCDRQGRPTVRVLVHGVLDERFWNALRARRLYPSSKREYYFIEPDKGWEVVPSEDPTQPIVAHVYAVDAKSSKMTRESVLWQLRVSGAPRPLVFVFGIRPDKLDPAMVADVRAMLDAMGYVGDECPVLAVYRPGGQGLDALVDALDEHFDGGEFRVRGHAAAQFADAMLDEARSRDAREIRGWVGFRAGYARWGRTAASDATLGALWDLLCDKGELDACATLLADRAVYDIARFERWFEAEGARGAVAPTNAFASVLHVFAAQGKQRAFERCFVMFLSATEGRRRAVLCNELQMHGGAEAIRWVDRVYGSAFVTGDERLDRDLARWRRRDR
ncbi:MAG: hypothetical protein JNK05_35195 [Myxococcales bacterium]|nr:hypothetical protein [Myxococcales bacterium]